jgi:hypothetical protein
MIQGPPCPGGLLCVELFHGLPTAADGGPGPPNDFTCRLHCECDGDCPVGFHCLSGVPRATNGVCVVDGLILPR